MTASHRHSSPAPLAEFPTVAVVIPCLNEAEHIARCLDSLVSSDFPKDRLLVRVCDGMSEDGTRGIVADYAERYPYISLCDNPERTTPHALNIGLRMGGFDVGIILGAHATVAPDMIQRNIDVLRSDAAIGCSGGVIENVYDNATARRILRMCQTDGKLDEANLLKCIRKVAADKPRDYRGILSALKRLVRLEVERRHVVVESATDLDTASRERVSAGLAGKYGSDLTYEFRVNPELLGGLKVRVGNDVFDGSVKGRLDRLAQAF